MTAQGKTWDVAVVGGGMAGITAAITAQTAGAETLVIEKRQTCGGNAALSAGMFLGSTDVDALHAYIPDGDIDLQRLLCAGYAPALEWLAGLGMPMEDSISFGDFRTVRPMGLGRPGDRREWMAAYLTRATDAGVTVRAGAGMRRLARTGAHLELCTTVGEVHVARAVILATGGFQGDSERLAAILGRGAAEALFLRSLPECRGDGLSAAESMGAGFAGRPEAFYGHTVPDVPLQPDQWQRLTPYFSRGGLLVNRAGRRFTDEAAGLLEETNPQEGCRQPGGVYWLIFDRGILNSAEAQGTASTLSDMDWLAEARAAGATVHECNTFDELARALAGEGVDRSQLKVTLRTYNGACRSSAAESLQPPRSPPFRALEEPPLFGVRCRAAITGTAGGIAINADTQILSAEGSERRAIPGVFAAGVDAGGYFGRTYNGFLGWALVSGRQAGMAAVRTALGMGNSQVDPRPNERWRVEC